MCCLARGVPTAPSPLPYASVRAGSPTPSRQHGRRDVDQARPRVRTAGAPDGPTAADDRHHQQPCPDEHPDNADPGVHDERVPGRTSAQTAHGQPHHSKRPSTRLNRAVMTSRASWMSTIRATSPMTLSSSWSTSGATSNSPAMRTARSLSDRAGLPWSRVPHLGQR